MADTGAYWTHAPHGHWSPSSATHNLTVQVQQYTGVVETHLPRRQRPAGSLKISRTDLSPIKIVHSRYVPYDASLPPKHDNFAQDGGQGYDLANPQRRPSHTPTYQQRVGVRSQVSVHAELECEYQLRSPNTPSYITHHKGAHSPDVHASSSQPASGPGSTTSTSTPGCLQVPGQHDYTQSRSHPQTPNQLFPYAHAAHDTRYTPSPSPTPSVTLVSASSSGSTSMWHGLHTMPPSPWTSPPSSPSSPNPPLKTHPSNHTRGRIVNPDAGVCGPSNSMRIPQVPIQTADYSQYPPVVFRMKGVSDPGVRIGKVVGAKRDPLVDQGSMQPFRNTGLRYFNLHFTWSGYAPVVKRVKTCDKEVTLQELLPLVCESFNKWATSNDVRHAFNPHEGYALGVDVAPDNVSITELAHRGGSDWQLELWIPSRQAHRPGYS